MPIHKLSKRYCDRNKFNDIVIIGLLLLLKLYIIIINIKEKRKIVIPKIYQRKEKENVRITILATTCHDLLLKRK